MFLAGVGLGMLVAVVTGWAVRHAVQAGRAVRETEARLPGLRDTRSGARFKAGVWVTVAIGFFVMLVFIKAAE